MMTYDSKRHHRRSIRLLDYDYAQAGAYFVTICTAARECLFGHVAAGRMMLSLYGEIAHSEWSRSAAVRAELALDAFVVMPNHVHGLVILTNDASQDGAVGAHGRAPLQQLPLCRPPGSLGSFVAGFKAAATKRINRLRDTPGLPVWQRNYYEHVVRTEEELSRIREYIITNPLEWSEDPENPAVVGAIPEVPGTSL